MKKYSIENESLKVSVLKTGAELCSIYNKRNDKEYLWQGNPDIWGSHAPNLFPIIGTLKDGKYTFEGKEYTMPKHGLIRNNKNLLFKETTENELIFELESSEDTLKMYPFKFLYKITYILRKNQLQVIQEVTNLDDKSMYFNLGGHPAFNIQLYDKENLSDYSLEFNEDLDLETYLLDEDGLVSNKTEEILKNARRFQLTDDIFKKDALIFKNIEAKKISILSKENGRLLSVWYPDFEDLGIWSKPGAPFVCIEPWLGTAEHSNSDQKLENKYGIIKLDPEKNFSADYLITIT
ncbi:aldose 1-epimerase family protein [Gramella sp. AN32]|uniref:Aldose 1-epimerase family protein n=1 Tax=Christiangramia antarctica TaxID=2058158 RepID=A0ABW5X4J0_9FLAO|nr:aldose 1-epimerase family protein [Gramella sp. AN32]MCM4155640.1 aldose epimerase [Gramella sp. AN32]